MANEPTGKPDPRGGTNHPPGSTGRVRVMAHRAARGWNLDHPDDAKDYSDAARHSEAPKDPNDARRQTKLGNFQKGRKPRGPEYDPEPRGIVHGAARNLDRRD